MAARFQELTTYEEVKRWQDAGLRLYYRHKNNLFARPVSWTVSQRGMKETLELMRSWQYGYLAEDDD